MDFHLTKTQLMTQQAMKEFVRKETAALAKELDEKSEFPMTNYKQALELGILDITLPEALGGIDDGYLSFVIALEEFACGSAALALSLSVAEAITHLLCRFGSKNQQEHIEKLRQGKAFGAIALGVSGTVESEARQVDRHTGREDFHLNGRLRYVPNASLADMAIVFATSDAGSLCAYLVDAPMPGFTTGEPEALMGMQSLPVGRLELNGVRVSQAHRLGDEKLGRTIYEAIETRTQVAVGTLAVGISRAALEAAVKHSKNRVQFGKPLARMEAVKNKIADMAAAVEAARLLVYQAAFFLDQGRQAAHRAAMAKFFSSHVAVEICREAVQIHGGYGYVKDYPVERFYRDALFTQVYSTTNEIPRYRVADQVCRNITT